MENSVHSRRNLWGEIETRSLHVHVKFAHCLELLNHDLDTIKIVVDDVNDAVEKMDIDLRSVQDNTSKLIKRTETLKNERTQAVIRNTIASVFMDRFSLSEDQIVALSASSVSDAFFAALAQLQRINEDSKVLLSSDNPMAGLEIVEKMSVYEENAYGVLFKWTQSECLRNAFQALRLRQVLFETCIEELSLIRKASNQRSFLDALTRGGQGGTPKPIEMHAHDPLRYIGDMLAWIHQCAAGEREILEGLLGLRARNDSRRASSFDQKVALPSQSGAVQDDELILMSILDKNLEGTIRPLKVRIEQILQSQPGAIIAYKVSNLIQFYSLTITKTIGKESQLSISLNEFNELSLRVFYDTLNSQASALKDILSSYDSSLLPEKQKEQEVEKVLNATLDPLLQMCNEGATKLSLIESATFMINCLHFIHMALMLYPFTTRHVQVLEQYMDTQINVLIEEMYQNILMQSKLASFVQTIEKNVDKTPLALIPETNYRNISDVMQWLDIFLGTLGPDDTSSSITRLLSSTRTARLVLRGGYSRFLLAYKLVYEQVMDPANKYEYPSTILPRSVNDVTTLLALEI